MCQTSGECSLIYKIILKPIWTYGIPLWGTECQSNIEKLQRLQNKILRMVTKASWYVPNHVLHTDLQMPTIREEITRLTHGPSNANHKRRNHTTQLHLQSQNTGAPEQTHDDPPREGRSRQTTPLLTTRSVN